MRFFYSSLFLITLFISSCTTYQTKKIIYNPNEFNYEIEKRINTYNNFVKNEKLKINREIIKPPFKLDKNIKNFAKKCIKNAPTDKIKVEKIKNCLQTSAEKIEYEQFSNYDAITCFENKVGNCFSITNLAVGIARELGLNSYYILVEDMIGNQNTGNYIVHTNHIVCGVLLKNYMTEGAAANHETYDLIRKDYIMLIDFIPNPRKYRYTVRLTDIEATGLFYNNLASGKMIEGKLDEARMYFEAALTMFPNSYQIHNNLGVLYLKLGLWEKAEKHFEKALIYVKFPDLIMSNIIRHYERLNKPEKITEVLATLDKAKKRNPYFYIGESKRNIVNGNFNKALTNLKIAKKISKNLPEIYSLLSKVYKALGKDRKSEKAWKKFTKMTVAKVNN